MAATIASLPDSPAFAGEPVWLAVETDLIVLDYASFDIVITGTGPTVNQILRLTWPGATVLFTAGNTAPPIGLAWPLMGGGETLENYARRIADYLNDVEVIYDSFIVSFGGPTGSGYLVQLRMRVPGGFDLSYGENMAGIGVNTIEPATIIPPGLRAVVSVFADEGDPATDPRLVKLHSPYRYDSSQTWFDLSPAFHSLAPWLPPAAQINPVSPGSSLPLGDAETHYQPYYLRYADKYGTPATSEATERMPTDEEESFLAILGSRGGDSTRTGPGGLCHNYRRRDGATLVKPVTDLQPDWVYWLCPDEVSGVYVHLRLYWSDGTESTLDPWGTSPAAVLPGRVYHFPSGFRQLGLHLQSPPSGADPDAYLVGYDWQLGPIDDGSNYLATVRHAVFPFAHYQHYLIFHNGVGGLETVALRGKVEETYETETESYRRPRNPEEGTARDGAYVSRGDYALLGASGQPVWEFSTGYYPDPYYLVHLRQLPLADAWLIDLRNRRFLRVLVEQKTIAPVERDDETLHALTFTVRAAWSDSAATV